jgi:FkbM family methyltransferase
VYAFEPSFSTFAQLSKNIHLNQCQGRVIPMHLALSNKTEVGILNYSSLTPGTALHALGEAIDQHGKRFQPVYEQPVLSFRIDDLIKMFHVASPNHIKLDVDGVEFEILQGARSVLSNSNLVSILVEVEPTQESSQKIFDYLQSFGFSIASKKHHGGSELNTSNYLFIRESFT